MMNISGKSPYSTLKVTLPPSFLSNIPCNSSTSSSLAYNWYSLQVILTYIKETASLSLSQRSSHSRNMNPICYFFLHCRRPSFHLPTVHHTYIKCVRISCTLPLPALQSSSLSLTHHLHCIAINIFVSHLISFEVILSPPFLIIFSDLRYVPYKSSLPPSFPTTILADLR